MTSGAARAVVVAAVTAAGAALVGFACSSSSSPAAPVADAAPSAPMPDSSDAQVLRGWAAVNARGCPTCHQSPDASDGVLSGRTDAVDKTRAYPANLTPDPDTGIDAWDAATFAAALRKGVDDQGQQLCPTMPKFGDMKDDEAYAIAAYLKGLAAVHHDIPGSVCPPIKLPPDAGTDASDAAPSDAAEGG